MRRKIAPGIAQHVRFYSQASGVPVAASVFKSDMLAKSQAALRPHTKLLPETLFKHGNYLNPSVGFATHCMKSLIAPEPIHVERLIEMGCQSSKAPQFFNKKPGDMIPSNALGLVKAFSSVRTLLEEYLTETLKHPTQASHLPFTHTPKTNEALEQIIAGNQLLNMGQSTGVASQPGICLSTDLLATSALQALCGKGKLMLFFCVENTKRFCPKEMRLSKSMYQLSDKTTIVSSAPELPIVPIAFYSEKNQRLEIMDPMKFTDGPLASIVINYHLFEHQYFINLATFVSEFNIPFIGADGNSISYESVIKKPIDEGYQILERTLSELKKAIGNKNFDEKLYFEGIRGRLALTRNGLGEALKRPEILNALIARPLLAQLMQEAAYPKPATPTPNPR